MEISNKVVPPYELLAKEVTEGPKTIQANAIALGYPQELDSKILFCSSNEERRAASLAPEIIIHKVYSLKYCLTH